MHPYDRKPRGSKVLSEKRNQQAMEILQDNNLNLATHIVTIVSNTLEQLAEMSKEINDTKDAAKILEAVKTATSIVGLLPPSEVKIDITNKAVAGFEFIEMNADDVEVLEAEITTEGIERYD